MEAELIRKLLEERSSVSDEDHLRLVVTIREDTFQGVPTDPTQFPTRAAYRQALVERQAANTSASAAAELAARFRAIGLSAVTGPLSHSVVVEGRPATLSRALEDDAIENAVLDDQIELIRPVKVENQRGDDD